MSNNPPIRSQWLATFAALQAFRSETGSLPTLTTNRSLHTFAANQRSRYRRGDMPAEKVRLLSEIPGLLNRVPPADQLAAFVEASGRLPSSVAADPQEKALGRYLVHTLRPTVRTGTIGAATLTKAEKIPGALVWTRRPDQNSTLEEVKAYAAAHGHMPPTGSNGTEDENRLARWVRNNIKGERDAKTPALQARHDALAELLAAFPSKAGHAALSRIRELEAACAENGWKPAGHDGWLDSQLRMTADEILHARITKIIAHPPLREYQWRRDLALVKEFEASTGRLPRSWNDGRVYSWLATQRKEYRSGALAGWKTVLLQQVHGALPAVRRRAA